MPLNDIEWPLTSATFSMCSMVHIYLPFGDSINKNHYLIKITFLTFRAHLVQFQSTEWPHFLEFLLTS